MRMLAIILLVVASLGTVLSLVMFITRLDSGSTDRVALYFSYVAEWLLVLGVAAINWNLAKAGERDSPLT